MTDTRRDELARHLAYFDGYDLAADPSSRTAREMGPVYLARATELLASGEIANLIASAWDEGHESHYRDPGVPNPYRAAPVDGSPDQPTEGSDRE